MKDNFKDFYKFIQINNPLLCSLWEDFNNRPDPNKGDEYIYFESINQLGVSYTSNIIFDKILFDDKFNNGVAFYYIFHRKDNDEEIKIHTINDVYDYTKLTVQDQLDVYGFWKKCVPVNNTNN